MSHKSTDYNFAEIEPHWQKYWDENNTFHAPDASVKPKYYILDMFPYPSGSGLHIGHPEGYTASDILSRYKRAKGFNVLHPMGWDAFGLPAEQYAVQTGTHPAVTTEKNIQTFKRQIKQLGFALDWQREINTTDPKYYKWTQWIFLQIFKHGLAYVSDRPVWWCPALGTVLANEEVIDGKSERGSHPVERRALRQWVLKITAYAEKLLAGLDDVDWPDSTKRMQRAWIGRSEGVEITFDIDGMNEMLTVFTTRPDTLYGCTYMVVAPEHPLVQKLTVASQSAMVADYVKQAATKSDLDRTDLAKGKSGVFTGSYAINPVNGKKVPIWVADYVLMSYGTGAIMAVPAHDERDFEFAGKFGIEIIPVIAPLDGKEVKLPFCVDGKLVNSGKHDGLSTEDAKRAITQTLAEQKRGHATVNYKLRDWLFARQRYWGEPFPIVWVDESSYRQAASDKHSPVGSMLPPEPVTYKSQDGTIRYALPVPASELPVLLPKTDNYQPSGTGESPLANITEWVHVHFNIKTGQTVSAKDAKPNGGDWVAAARETNTMPQWAGSCWYHLRYIDPHNENALIDPKLEAYWSAPDFYIGGAEHAVLHLLYARFWHRFLFDIGVVKTAEPYKRLFHQGIILGEDGEKMSKSRGNVVNPDDIIREYGADSLRLYEMFLGPLEAMKPWSTRNIEGVFRFLKKSWREIIDQDGNMQSRISKDASEPAELTRCLHETIKKVGDDIENLRLNTAISQLMIFVNALSKAESVAYSTVRAFIQMLSCFAPHIGEELWNRIGEKESVSKADWPEFDPEKLVSDEAKIIIQVNGKLRGDITMKKDSGQATVIAAAKEQIKQHLDGKTIVKEIYVPNKIVNIVIK